MGYGPAKVRARVTQQMYDATYQFYMTDAQKATLETFYADNKAAQWDWTYPSATSYRFMGAPVFTEVNCDLWACQIIVEEMP
jgi:hypothetical protein